jgi:membrane associated rhomboid family serine protease
MLLFPIGTDRPQRRFPWMNVLLIAANIVVYLLTHGAFQSRLPGLPPVAGVDPAFDKYLLDPRDPHLFEFITYQFLHQDLSHIGFNMLFLYVFGNNLNEKLGHVGYLAFYLTGGVLAGCGQLLTSNSPTLGASGAISAVTGLFLVLLPLTHIRMFFSFFFLYMDIWEIPSLYFILFKIGQDVYEQLFSTSRVAYMAHLSGTVAGILIGLFLLFARLIQRDHYDLLAMLNRYRRRKSYEALVAKGYNPFNDTRGVSGAARKGDEPLPAVDPRVESLRGEISRLIRLHELGDAVQRYLELRTVDPAQVLPTQEQLDIANQLMAEARYPEAAAAYEDYLRVYSSGVQREQVMLILGLIYARYFPKPDRARELFTAVIPRLHNPQERDLAESELQKLGPAPPLAT